MISHLPTRIGKLRVEHVTYPGVVAGRLVQINSTNVMFESGGKQFSSRYHYHLSQQEAENRVKQSLERGKK